MITKDGVRPILFFKAQFRSLLLQETFADCFCQWSFPLVHAQALSFLQMERPRSGVHFLMNTLLVMTLVLKCVALFVLAARKLIAGLWPLSDKYLGCWGMQLLSSLAFGFLFFSHTSFPCSDFFCYFSACAVLSNLKLFQKEVGYK